MVSPHEATCRLQDCVVLVTRSEVAPFLSVGGLITSTSLSVEDHLVASPPLLFLPAETPGLGDNRFGVVKRLSCEHLAAGSEQDYGTGCGSAEGLPCDSIGVAEGYDPPIAETAASVQPVP